MFGLKRRKHLFPGIFRWECRACGHLFHQGNPVMRYAMDEAGERHPIHLPGGRGAVEQVLGLSLRELKRAGRIGGLRLVLCRDCDHVFQIDLKRDSHACLECRSENTVDLESFAGEACPKCGRGKIKAKQIAKI